MNQPRAIFGQNGFAEADGWAQAYCVDHITSEYLGAMDAWVSTGTGLPVGAHLDPPPARQPGKAIIRAAGDWQLVDDYRGQAAYIKLTGAKTEITELGEIPLSLTLLAPSSPYDIWDDEAGAWIKDEAAEADAAIAQAQAARAARVSEAAQHIAILDDAVDLGIATEAEQAAHTAWRQYRVLLTRLDLSQQPIAWPPKPATAS